MVLTALMLHLATPQVLDLLFVMLSLALFAGYHAWYYSWHLWSAVGQLNMHDGYHRLDMTGQSARAVFTQAILLTGSDPDFNLAVQTMRNPITAASILGTGASVGITTLITVILDSSKMDAVRRISEKDPFTGASTIIEPEAKLGTAVAALFLSFFSLAQALRLFVHYPFLVRAAAHCRASHPELATPILERPEGGGQCFEDEAIRTCLRGQTFFSLGLRFLYLFILLVMWTLGGTWLLAGTVVEVCFLYTLDQL